MITAKKMQILIGSLLLAALAFIVTRYGDQLGMGALRYETYEMLSEEKISSQDLQKVLELHQECFEGDRRKNLLNFYLQVKYPHSDEYMRSYLKEQVESSMQQARLNRKAFFRQKQDVTLLRQGSEIIGLYSCAREEKASHGSMMIYDVCLTEKKRGKGIGKNMMVHAIEQCAKGGKDLALTVYKDNEATVALYKKLKFVIVPMPDEVSEDFEYFNKYLMRYQP
jgi:ribosomal protein S18 acetylase RimI-like enzyme